MTPYRILKLRSGDDIITRIKGKAGGKLLIERLSSHSPPAPPTVVRKKAVVRRVKRLANAPKSE